MFRRHLALFCVAVALLTRCQKVPAGPPERAALAAGLDPFLADLLQGENTELVAFAREAGFALDTEARRTSYVEAYLVLDARSQQLVSSVCGSR